MVPESPLYRLVRCQSAAQLDPAPRARRSIVNVGRSLIERKGNTLAWSTSQLAELAGTTIKAVRHYHEIGLLDEPERLSNGYKQYTVAHLLRLLQIARLSDLGVPLAQIASLAHADQDPDEAIKVLDAELQAAVERLQRIRGELALILHHRATAELPAGFSEVANELSDADRSLVMIYSRLFDDSAMDDLKLALQAEPRTDADRELAVLAPDADRATRQRLGEALAPAVRRQLQKAPWLQNPASKALRNAKTAEKTMAAAMQELYNPAQLEVIYRAYLIGTDAADQLAALEAEQDRVTAAR
jgi:DNA-binding transcriptional MerR regulator